MTFFLYLHPIYAIVVYVREKETEMAPMAVNIEAATPVIEHCHLLPTKRNEWSSGAQAAHREVLGELDAWCRKQDSPKGLNMWIAEEAIRQSW